MAIIPIHGKKNVLRIKIGIILQLTAESSAGLFVNVLAMLVGKPTRTMEFMLLGVTPTAGTIALDHSDTP